MKKIEMTKKKATLDQGYDEFILNCKARNLREFTIKFYDNTMRTIYKFIDPKTYIDTITNDTVDRLIVGCQDELDIKYITINTYLRVLKTTLYYFISFSYTDKFHISEIKYDKEIIEIYTKSELKIILRKVDINVHYCGYEKSLCINISRFKLYGIRDIRFTKVKRITLATLI